MYTHKLSSITLSRHNTTNEDSILLRPRRNWDANQMLNCSCLFSTRSILSTVSFTLQKANVRGGGSSIIWQ